MMKLFMLMMVTLTSIPTNINVTRAASLAKQGCQERCGKVTVPFPFGIGTGCYLHRSFEVLCEESSEDASTAPLRFAHNNEFPILEISMESVRVLGKPAVTCKDFKNTWVGKTIQLDDQFSFSHERNVFVAAGCHIFAMATFHMVAWPLKESVGCYSFCSSFKFMPFSKCVGINGCCQTSIPVETTEYMVQLENRTAISECVGAFIVEKDHYPYLPGPVPTWFHNIPVVINWVVGQGTCHQAKIRGDGLCGQNTYCTDTTKGHGYNCRCMEGYKGNPYLPNGCKDINECQKQDSRPCRLGEQCVNTPGSYECISLHRRKQPVSGIIAILIGFSAFCAIGYSAFTKHARIKINMIKQKFFIRNGGNLLKQKISANKSCVIKIKIHVAEEMEKATDGFSRKRFLGKGGQGTVYKGLLRDGTIVAIKKSNAIDEDQVEQFVNELLILAQINHRNIVKLLGCCLEYEVPILVYEYLSNGTLSQHLHDGAEVSKFSWKDRIRIAREVAGALAYLHSYASTTIFHRDIKPLNILFDENYKAVVSDFGLSRSVALNRTHLTTQIEGTFGYLDPEYFQSGQFTAKSDVYAFGVVLTELLTRRKSVSSSDSDDQGMVPQFRYLMKHNRVLEIVDKQVVQEAWTDDILVVAKLAKRCMKRNAKKRPGMIEVVKDLDRLKIVQPELPHKCIKDEGTSNKS